MSDDYRRSVQRLVGVQCTYLHRVDLFIHDRPGLLPSRELSILYADLGHVTSGRFPRLTRLLPTPECSLLSAPFNGWVRGLPPHDAVDSVLRSSINCGSSPILSWERHVFCLMTCKC